MKAQTTRRAVMAGIAAAPVAGLPALAGAVSGDDPIFAAIERHRATFSAFARANELTDEVLAKQQGREVTAADRAAYNAASDAENEVLAVLLGTVPQTRAGARAVVEYLIEFDSGCEPRTSGEYLQTLIKSPVLQSEPLS